MANVESNRGLSNRPYARQAQNLREIAIAHQLQTEALLARRRRARRLWVAALLVAAGTVGGVFQSCASHKDADPSGALAAEAPAAPGKVTVKTEPAFGKETGKRKAPTKEQELAKAQYDQAATDLQAMFDRVNRGERLENTELSTLGEKTGDPEKIRPAKKTGVRPPQPAPTEPETPAAAPSEPAARAPVAVPQDSKTLSQRRAELATELASLLQPAEESGTDAFKAIAPLLAVETLEPGSAQPEIDVAMRAMTTDERSAVTTVRDLLRQIGRDPQLLSDPEALGRKLNDYAARLNVSNVTGDPADGLTLGNVALCTRVESFGRYSTYPTNRFIAGRASAAILYVEVGNFAQVPLGNASLDGSGEGYAVELAQQARLFHDDGTLQWKYSSATIRDTSRTRRRDFFVVQRIELPANLSIGKYTLKVTVRDVGSGGMEAEATVPIQIVADPTISQPVRAKADGPESKSPVVDPKKLAKPLARGADMDVDKLKTRILEP